MNTRLRSILTWSVLAGMIGVIGSSSAYARTADTLQAAQPKTAVVLRFAVQWQPIAGTAALSSQACPPPASSVAPLSDTPPATGTTQPTNTGTQSATGETVNPKVLDIVTGELQKRLSRDRSVLVDPDPKSIPVGALVISGCITRVVAGNAAGRLVGMNIGASHLGVHVVALSKTPTGWSPVDAFNIQVKGGSILPPLGPLVLTVHAVRDTRQNLSVDAKKLADQILKKLAKDARANKQIATGS